jgi:hypothetical protein
MDQYCFVVFDALGQVVTVTTAGGYAVGVLQDKPHANDPGFVCGPGDLTKIQCGGTFAAGDRLTSDVNGQAVVAAAGAPFLGFARAAGAPGAITEMLFQPQGFMTP